MSGTVHSAAFLPGWSRIVAAGRKIVSDCCLKSDRQISIVKTMRRVAPTRTVSFVPHYPQVVAPAPVFKSDHPLPVLAVLHALHHSVVE